MKGTFDNMFAFMPKKMLISEFRVEFAEMSFFFFLAAWYVWWDTSGYNFGLRHSRCGEGKAEVRSRSGGRSLQTWRLVHVAVNTSGGSRPFAAARHLLIVLTATW